MALLYREMVYNPLPIYYGLITYAAKDIKLQLMASGLTHTHTHARAHTHMHTHAHAHTHAHTHTHTATDIRTKAISGNQACTSLWPVCTWLNKSLSKTNASTELLLILLLLPR